MLKIRLRRTGQKHQPSYRIVVADKDSPRDGRFVEILGHYNPRTEPVTFEVKADRVQHWVSQGAQPTETVHRLLHARGIIETEPPKRELMNCSAFHGALLSWYRCLVLMSTLMRVA